MIHKNKEQRPLLSVEEVKLELSNKGWTNRDLSKYWGCSEEYVSKIVNNADRRRWFDDALRGLPNVRKMRKVY